MTTSADHLPPLIRSLLAPSRYPHPVTEVCLMETHISWVLLAGEFAYKLKKAVNFGFLDFSTLERRKFCCEEELRLNRRQAPDLYLDVIAITGAEADPHLGGDNDVIEYAVKMRRFEQYNLFEQRLKAGTITADDIDRVAVCLAHFHEKIAVAKDSDIFGSLDNIRRYSEENCRVVAPLLENSVDRQHMDEYQDFLNQQHPQLASIFSERKHNGHIRECHGDLHIRNILLENGNIRFFDCIEFNPELRWVDTLSELAFLAMDLEANGYAIFSHRLINHYLELSGDYAGAPVLPYYLAYRAMVRAKVALLRLPQAESDSEKTALRQNCGEYLQLAWRYALKNSPALIITHGLSGSGKSTHTQWLVDRLGALKLRSDVERKRRFTANLHSDNDSAHVRTPSSLYSAATTRDTYEYLLRLAEILLEAGFPVIIDATHLQRWQRDLFRAAASTRNIPFVIVNFDIPLAELERRIAVRQTQARDASDATVEVLHQQLASREPLDGEELAHVFNFEGDWQKLLARLLTSNIPE